MPQKRLSEKIPALIISVQVHTLRRHKKPPVSHNPLVKASAWPIRHELKPLAISGVRERDSEAYKANTLKGIRRFRTRSPKNPQRSTGDSGFGVWRVVVWALALQTSSQSNPKVLPHPKRTPAGTDRIIRYYSDYCIQTTPALTLTVTINC